MRERRPLLAEVLKRALPADARRRIYSVPLIEKRWASVVGDEIARRSEPESLEGGVLKVRVTDPAWGRMILKLQGRIVPALNRAVGTDLVRRINFVTRAKLSGPEAPRVVSRPSDPLGAPPEIVSRASENITDPELRALVLGSASRYLRARDDRRRK